jgi:hypothetical protein
MDEFFAFNASAMEAFGAFGEELDDVVKDKAIGEIDYFRDFVARKQKYKALLKQARATWTCDQDDLNKAATRNWSTWPSHGFLANLMAVVYDSKNAFDGDSAADQLRHYNIDGATAFKAVEMWLMATPIADLRDALRSTTPNAHVQHLFNREFALWRRFAAASGAGRITAITAPPFADLARAAAKRTGKECWIYERDATAGSTADDTSATLQLPKRLAKRTHEAPAAASPPTPQRKGPRRT